MKKTTLIIMILLLLSTLVQAKNICTQEQIDEMVKHEFSYKTIKFTCQNYQDDESSQVQRPAQTYEKNELKEEYLFFKAGYGTFSISETSFSQDSLNIGIQYFFNSLSNGGLGIGYSSSYASSKLQTATTAELELLFNIASKDGNTLTSSIIVGNLYESIENTTNKSNSLNGYGLYITYASVVNKGQGLSLFFKNLYTEDNRVIKLLGLNFTW